MFVHGNDQFWGMGDVNEDVLSWRIIHGVDDLWQETMDSYYSYFIYFQVVSETKRYMFCVKDEWLCDWPMDVFRSVVQKEKMWKWSKFGKEYLNRSE